MRVSRSHAIFAIACVVAIAVEGYVVFLGRDDALRIEGLQRYDVGEFATGGLVSHSFLMSGDGLHAVRVQFNSDTRASANVQWTLWRGMRDVPQDMTRAFETVETIALRPGPQWKSLAFTRDASSRERWYTIDVKLLETAPPARVRLMASKDNPERGGVLWVSGVRQPGSLVMRAERRGRTPYRRFVAEAEPHLPFLLRVHAVQWAVVGAVHWALIAFGWAVISDARRRPSPVVVP